ncbi:MAG: hypothetical protein IJT61_04005 [Bacteroidales bacterium]|nr:hypothetical protein [Bacteroidales bacterium]
MEQNTTALTTLNEAKQNFALAMQDAQSLDIVNNLAAAFDAALIVNRLEAVLTDDVMKAVFMPLMNKKIGFKTDRDPAKKDKRTGTYPTPYPIDVVRTCIIDGAANGLLPMGNQWNIIAGSMYPTKEGYTALLAKMKASMGLVYSFEFDPETNAKSADPSYVAIPCRISYRTNRDDLKGWFKYVAMVKSNGETSTTDQLRGKAERKCKRAFYEFLTGLDLGDADADTVEATYTEVKPSQTAKSAAEKAREMMEKRKAEKEATTAQSTATGGIQPNINFNDMSDEEVEKMWENNGEGVQQ